MRPRDGPQPQRWRVLDAVASLEEPATIDEIVDELRDRRVESDPLGDLESWDRTHERLHDVDLPALDAAGLLTFDDDRGVVTVPPAVTGGPFATAATTEAPGVTDEPTASRDRTSRNDATATDRTVEGPDAPAAERVPDAGSSANGQSGRDVAWPRRYLAATLFGAGLLLASTSTLVPGGELATTVAGGFVVALFAVLATVHEISTR